MSHCGKKNVSSVNSLQKYTNHKQINLTFVSELKGPAISDIQSRVLRNSIK